MKVSNRGISVKLHHSWQLLQLLSNNQDHGTTHWPRQGQGKWIWIEFEYEQNRLRRWWSLKFCCSTGNCLDREQPLSGAAAPAQLPAKGKQLVFRTPELGFSKNSDCGRVIFQLKTTEIIKHQPRIEKLRIEFTKEKNNRMIQHQVQPFCPPLEAPETALLHWPCCKTPLAAKAKKQHY